MKDEDRKPSVYGTVKQIIVYLNSPEEQRNLAGSLAALRNSTGKDYEYASEIWPIIFPHMPEEFMGKNEPTHGEKAVYIAMQLYAIGQQGTRKTENKAGINSMGASLRAIRGKDSKALDRRFNMMITSTTFDEFVYHLRQLFKLGKSNGITVDFPELGEDLFWYQNGRSRQVCLKWAKEYYRPSDRVNTENTQTDSNNNQEV